MGGFGSLSFGMLVAHLGRREAPRVEILSDPIQRLPRVAVAREPPELRVHRVARADLDLAVAHAGVEVVQRPDGRAAGHLALEVVHAAVARADEARRRLGPAHRTAE